MRKHWKSLIYLLQHKYWVYYFGRQLGLGYWQLIIHDLTKFLPCEWFAYTNYFHSNHPDRQNLYKGEFIEAWKHHWRNNPHHWNYWDHGLFAPNRMSNKFVREMIADWLSAGYCQEGKVELLHWYEQNKDRISLHPETRIEVERLIIWWYQHYYSESNVRN